MSDSVSSPTLGPSRPAHPYPYHLGQLHCCLDEAQGAFSRALLLVSEGSTLLSDTARRSGARYTQVLLILVVPKGHSRVF